MKSVISFTIRDVLSPQVRPKLESVVKSKALQTASIKKWECTKLPLTLNIKVGLTIPKSKSKKFKERMLHGVEYPTDKLDIANLLKTVTDAMSGIFYVDTKQIVSVNVSKEYGAWSYLDVELDYAGTYGVFL